MSARDNLRLLHAQLGESQSETLSAEALTDIVYAIFKLACQVSKSSANTVNVLERVIARLERLEKLVVLHKSRRDASVL